jgi:hypothetical protein
MTPKRAALRVFPALVPLAVLLACGALALRGRWRELYLGAASAASCGLLVVVWLSVLRGLYV